MSRVAVVTGGGSGLGRSIATRLASDGNHVAVLDHNTDAAEQARLEIESAGGRAIALATDVADEDAVDRAFDAVRAEFGPVGILVTSAAVSGFARLDKITLEEWNRFLAVNLTGTFLCIRAALLDMVPAGWGRIITISSSAGQKGAQGQAHYSATKGGVIALTKTVALDYAAKGVTANTVPPFAIETPMLREQQAAGKLPPDKYLNQVIPAGALGRPQDVAAVCSFLAAEDAGYVTGQVIGVNGGAVT